MGSLEQQNYLDNPRFAWTPLDSKSVAGPPPGRYGGGMHGFPPLVDATVLEQIPDSYRVLVSVDFLGGQTLFLPVDVLTHGPRDAVRGSFPPLPTPGTRGLVAFTRGDDRTGRWLGSQAPSLPDASEMAPGRGNTRYTAEWSGAWSRHGEDGSSAFAWPDGSTLMIGPTDTMPVPTRHVVGPDGARGRSVFTPEQRNPTPPAPFVARLNFANGASIAIAADGSVTVTPAPGRPVTVAGDAHATGGIVAGFGGADQVGVQTHTHTTPAGNSGPPIPGT